MSFDSSTLGALTARVALRGGWDVAVLTGTQALTKKSGNLQELDPGGAARDVTLPAVTRQDDGYFFFISNTGEGAEDLTVKDAAAATIATVKAGEVGVVFVDSAGAWQSYALVQQSLVSKALVTATIALGAEAGDVIAVSLQCVDLAGVSVARAQRYVVSLFEATMIEALAAAFTMAATTGVEVSTTLNARAIIETTAAGVAVIDVSDVATGSGKTIYMIVEPIPLTGVANAGLPVMIAIIFD